MGVGPVAATQTLHSEGPHNLGLMLPSHCLEILNFLFGFVSRK